MDEIAEGLRQIPLRFVEFSVDNKLAFDSSNGGRFLRSGIDRIQLRTQSEGAQSAPEDHTEKEYPLNMDLKLKMIERSIPRKCGDLYHTKKGQGL